MLPHDGQAMFDNSVLSSSLVESWQLGQRTRIVVTHRSCCPANISSIVADASREYQQSWRVGGWPATSDKQKLCAVGLGHPVLLSLRAAGDRLPVLALFPLFGALCKKPHVRDRRVIEQILSIPQIRGGR